MTFQPKFRAAAWLDHDLVHAGSKVFAKRLVEEITLSRPKFCLQAADAYQQGFFPGIDDFQFLLGLDQAAARVWDIRVDRDGNCFGIEFGADPGRRPTLKRIR